MSALRDALAEVAEAGDADDPRGLLRGKNRFYEVLFDGADNATIRSILGGLQARVAVLRATSLTARTGRGVPSRRSARSSPRSSAGTADAAAEAAAFHVRRAAEAAFGQIEPGPDRTEGRRADG